MLAEPPCQLLCLTRLEYPRPIVELVESLSVQQKTSARRVERLEPGLRNPRPHSKCLLHHRPHLRHCSEHLIRGSLIVNAFVPSLPINSCLDVWELSESDIRASNR